MCKFYTYWTTYLTILVETSNIVLMTTPTKLNEEGFSEVKKEAKTAVYSGK